MLFRRLLLSFRRLSCLLSMFSLWLSLLSWLCQMWVKFTYLFIIFIPINKWSSNNVWSINSQLMQGPWFNKQEMKQLSFVTNMDMRCLLIHLLDGNISLSGLLSYVVYLDLKEHYATLLLGRQFLLLVGNYVSLNFSSVDYVHMIWVGNVLSFHFYCFIQLCIENYSWMQCPFLF